MVKNIIAFLLMINLIIPKTFAGDYTYQGSISFPACPTSNLTNASDCYPFFYVTQMPDGNIFYNFLCNVVAGLNWFSPTITLGVIKGTEWFLGWRNNDIQNYVNSELMSLDQAQEKIRDSLNEIVTKFPNGIGENEGDFALISGAVEKLNRHGCKKCIQEFVNLVKNDNSQFEKSINLLEEDISEVDYKVDPTEHAKNFRRCADEWSKGSKCQNHKFEKICEVDFDGDDEVACCFTEDYTKCGHWSSWVWTGFAMLVPSVTPLFFDKINRAGAYFGDMANMSNIITIPFAGLFAVWQHWMNSDKIKADWLRKEIITRLKSINGIIEISAQTIGSMENNISYQQARNILSALVLIGWPEKQVKRFIALAGDAEKSPAKKRKVKRFIKSLRNLYETKSLPVSADRIFRKAANRNPKHAKKAALDSTGNTTTNENGLMTDEVNNDLTIEMPNTEKLID